jgi:hypothetical protein
MELVTVTIIGQAITARYGTLNTGDVLRTDAAFAKHLVEDCCAAVYAKGPAPETAPAKTGKARKPRTTSVPAADLTTEAETEGDAEDEAPTEQPAA